MTSALMSSVPEGNMLPVTERTLGTEVQVQRVPRVSGLMSVSSGMGSVTLSQSADLPDVPAKVKVR